MMYMSKVFLMGDNCRHGAAMMTVWRIYREFAVPGTHSLRNNLRMVFISNPLDIAEWLIMIHRYIKLHDEIAYTIALEKLIHMGFIIDP